MIDSIWEYADASRQALLWHPNMPLEEASLVLDLELAERGWTRYDLRLDPALEFVLPGQLLKTRALRRTGHPLAETYADERDYGQALATPVALAFPPPDELMISLDHQQARFRATHLLPPPTLGLFGVVFSRRTRWIYPLSELDAAVHQLHEELAEVLKRLSDHDYDRLSARYKHAQVCALQLAVCYREYHQYQQTSSTKSDSDRPPATFTLPLSSPSTGSIPHQGMVVPPLFAQGTVSIPAALPVRATFVATLAPAQKWQANAEGIPTFTYQKEGEGTTLVEVRPKQLLKIFDEMILARLWQIVEGLSPLEGFLFLALLGFARVTPADDAGNHYVTAERLLEARGILPKTPDEKQAIYHAADYERIAAAMDRLNSIWLQVDPDLLVTSLPGAEPIQELWSRRSKLLHIDRVRLKTRVWPGITTTQLVPGDTAQVSRQSLPIAWDFHFGGWLAPFLQAPTRQMVRIDQATLSYHLSDRLWEGLLLQYITFQAHTHRRQGPLRLQVGVLFDELSLPLNCRHPQKTLDRFHQALKCLVKDGHCIEATPDYDESKFPEHHWVEDHWFKSTITVLLRSPE